MFKAHKWNESHWLKSHGIIMFRYSHALPIALGSSHGGVLGAAPVSLEKDKASRTVREPSKIGRLSLWKMLESWLGDIMVNLNLMQSHEEWLLQRHENCWSHVVFDAFLFFCTSDLFSPMKMLRAPWEIHGFPYNIYILPCWIFRGFMMIAGAEATRVPNFRPAKVNHGVDALGSPGCIWTSNRVVASWEKIYHVLSLWGSYHHQRRCYPERDDVFPIKNNGSPVQKRMVRAGWTERIALDPSKEEGFPIWNN